MWTARLPVIVWHKYMQIQTFCLILYIVLTILLAMILPLILEISTTYRLASYLLADNWLICRLHTQCMISKCDVKLVRCDGVFVIIQMYTMYNKTVIGFSVCDMQNNQGLGTCKFYQPQPLAWLITYTSTLIIPDITKASSNNCSKLFWLTACIEAWGWFHLVKSLYQWVVQVLHTM